MLRVTFAGLLLCMLLPIDSIVCGDDQRMELLDSLAAREERFDRFEIEWTVSMAVVGVKEPQLMEYALKMDGPRLRHVYRSVSVIDPVSGSPHPRTNTLTYNGKECRAFTARDTGETTGYLGEPSLTTFQREPGRSPMLLWFRPLMTDLHGWDPQAAELTTEGQILNCRHADSFQELSYRYDRDFHPMGWEVFMSFCQYSLEYQYDNATRSEGTVPSGWLLSRLEPDGTVSRVMTATVTKFDPDPEFTDADFFVEFPFATPVLDGNADGAMYVVRQDGTLRPVVPEETLGRTWEELAALPVLAEVRHLDESRRKRMYWMMLIGAVILLGAVKYYRSRLHAV